MKEEYIQSGRVNQKLETREKILKAAQFFLNDGEDFTLEDVAKKANLSRATIYRYFSNTEILVSEAGLDISTQSPDTLFKKLKGKRLDVQLLGIQDYFNAHAIENEPAFRKFLSIVLTSNATEIKRGARRKKTLQLALANSKLTPQENINLANLLTMMMGIEPLVISKDVCSLDNIQSKELMRWGMGLILKGIGITP